MIGSFLFLLGLSMGSFINCLVYRLNGNLTLKGRSFCPKCKHQLAWFDNIPLLSFILLKGKCRYCRQKISIHYPLVELGTGIITFLVFQLHLGGVMAFASLQSATVRGVFILHTLYLMLLSYALIAIFLSDLLYFTIPDEIVWPAIGVALLFHLQGGGAPPLAGRHLGGVLVSGLMAAAFFLALVVLTHGKGMGMGDVKLAFLMGLVLGYPDIIIALYLAFLTGALIGVTLILLRKKRLKAHIPFGPFLVGSTIGILFYGEQIKSFVFSIFHF